MSDFLLADAAAVTTFQFLGDAVFGFRAAGAALLSNVSHDHGTVAHWDPEKMKLEDNDATKST
jgi:hypothetical protein